MYNITIGAKDVKAWYEDHSFYTSLEIRLESVIEDKLTISIVLPAGARIADIPGPAAPAGRISRPPTPEEQNADTEHDCGPVADGAGKDGAR